MSNNIELQLTNGKKVIITNFDKTKVYDIREKSISKFSFSLKFPFVKIIKNTIIKFRYRTIFNYVNSYLDSEYSVDCNLRQFCKIVGIEVNHWEKSIMDLDLRGYS